MYALVDYIGNQILIKEGEKIKIPFLNQKVGTSVLFNNVLFFDNGKNKKIGNPYIKSVSFSGKIDSHGKENKIIVFKKKRRKGYKVKNGHRQLLTELLIEKISQKKSPLSKSAEEKPKAASKPKAVVKPKKNSKK